MALVSKCLECKVLWIVQWISFGILVAISTQKQPRTAIFTIVAACFHNLIKPKITTLTIAVI